MHTRFEQPCFAPAAADPTALIPGLEEQIDVPALDLARLSSQDQSQLRGGDLPPGAGRACVAVADQWVGHEAFRLTAKDTPLQH